MENGSESRTITRGSESETFPYVPPTSQTSLPAISESAALRVSDIFACVRLLANAIGSLPARVYRRLPDGSRVPAGADQRLVQLLSRPEPGSTASDLLATIMVHLLVHGDCFLGKFRREGSITQLACIDPQSVVVERKGERVIYKVSRFEGLSEHGPADILHIKAVSQDGLGRSVGTAAERPLELEEELELTLGEPPAWFEGDSAFPSEADRRAAYEAHRDKLGGWRGRIPGHRCRGFWQYETDLPEPLEGEEAIFWLAEHGLLEKGELDMIATTSAAAKARIGTVAEVDADVKTATLYKRVIELGAKA